MHLAETTVKTHVGLVWLVLVVGDQAGGGAGGAGGGVAGCARSG
jgi:hypothetical protein